MFWLSTILAEREVVSKETSFKVVIWGSALFRGTCKRIDLTLKSLEKEYGTNLLHMVCEQRQLRCF